MNYKRLEVKTFAQKGASPSAESKYWQKFRNPIVHKEYAAVTSIKFQPQAPFDYAVTSSTRVQVYDAVTHAVKKTISRFTDTAYSGHMRADGRLLVAGDATGTAQVFDLLSRSILRTLKIHTDPVHVARFAKRSNAHLLTAGDDHLVCVWDVSSETPLRQLREHTDYVRSADWGSTADSSLFVTGGYDHRAKLWDVRVGSDAAVATFEHERPVEAVLMFPTDMAVAAAAGNAVHVWDLRGGSGTAPLHRAANHTKTVTSLCFDAGCSRLLTGSLDQHVKVFDVQSFAVAHSFKYNDPVLSVALAPTSSALCVGTVNGILSVRQRPVAPAEAAASAELARASDRGVAGGRHAHFMRGRHAAPPAAAHVAPAAAQPRLSAHDRLLKQFRYADALDAVVGKGADADLVVTLLEELIHQDALRTALRGRDDTSLQPILRFLVRYVAHPKYCSVLLDTAETVLDIYGGVVGVSPPIDQLLRHLRYALRHELGLQRQLSRILGQLDVLGSQGTSLTPPHMHPSPAAASLA